RSLSISEYSTVKSPPVPKMLEMPNWRWIYEHFILPEELELHSAAMKSYTESLTSYVLSALREEILAKWSGAIGFKWNYYDAYAISAFRQMHPSGLGSIEQFYSYAQKGLGLGATVLAAKAKAKIQSTGVNPFLFLSKVSGDAQGSGTTLIAKLNASE